MARKALLVGINTYPGCPLNGCVNDVINVAKMLVRQYGWSMADMRIIKDDEATKANIMQGIKWLCDCRPGDVVYYHFSGHGSQIADVAGFVNGMADMECPVDLDWTPDTMLLDHELFAQFATIPDGVQFNWCSDSCHSGDMARSFPRKGCGAKARFMAPPAHMQAKVDAAKARGCRTFRDVHGGRLGVGYISGCRSDQTSADAFIDNTPCGAFTYYFLKNLQACSQKSVSDLTDAIVQDLAANGYDQHPVAQGLFTDRPFLGAAEAAKFVPEPILPEPVISNVVPDAGASDDCEPGETDEKVAKAGRWWDVFLPWKW